ncbi:MAG: acyltransferase [Deltaproteobacteria bacterium]|nr:acyltransferase [Deltaproteobacteria bacterium]
MGSEKIWDTPWKAQNEIRRRISYPRVRLIFAWHGISWGRGWRIYGSPIIQKHRCSRMNFGPGLQLRSFVRSNPLGPNHPVLLATWKKESSLEVGANFAMTGGALVASSRILIGNNVTVGANSVIIDTDFHPIGPEDRRLNPAEGKEADVIIEDDVFIGMNCLILKGVTMGRGSLAGAGSVVTSNVPSGVIVAGNPAQPVREL